MSNAHFCPNCGTAHTEGAHFCEECGASLLANAGAPPAPASEGNSSRKGLWFALTAVVAVLAVLAVAWIVILDDDAAEAEVFLEPVGFTGESPFTNSIDIHNESSASAENAVATTQPAIALPTPANQAVPVATRGVGGNWPGLYGGTRNSSTCDKDQLVAFLKDNPAKARAWAGVIGIRVADIEAYVANLTPIILQRDTRVTNHGFRNGQATSLQSVLQAGTAVMVDEFGVPRVKCNCGNPLSEPQALPRRPRYTGTRWPTFAPVNVVRVTVDVTVNVFILVDVKGGEPINRPVGTVGDDDTTTVIEEVCDLYPDDPSCEGVGEPEDPGGSTETEGPDGTPLGTGDVQFTLRWSTAADLDLAVTAPGGDQVNYNSPQSSSGGQLDVDSNQDCDAASSGGVENVFWPTGQAPEGDYTVTVTYFAECGNGTGPQSFELTYTSDGSEAELVPASLRTTENGTVATYELELGAGRPSLLGRAGGSLQKVADTVNPGESKAYRATKAPPATTTTAPATTAPAPAPSSEATTVPEGDPVPEPPDCSDYPEGSMMRILCEHDPFSS